MQIHTPLVQYSCCLYLAVNSAITLKHRQTIVSSSHPHILRRFLRIPLKGCWHGGPESSSNCSSLLRPSFAPWRCSQQRPKFRCQENPSFQRESRRWGRSRRVRGFPVSCMGMRSPFTWGGRRLRGTSAPFLFVCVQYNTRLPVEEKDGKMDIL